MTRDVKMAMSRIPYALIAPSYFRAGVTPFEPGDDFAPFLSQSPAPTLNPTYILSPTQLPPDGPQVWAITAAASSARTELPTSQSRFRCESFIFPSGAGPPGRTPGRQRPLPPPHPAAWPTSPPCRLPAQPGRLPGPAPGQNPGPRPTTQPP